MASRKKGSREHLGLRWSHRARRGMFLIGLMLAFAVAAMIAMGG